MKLTFVSSKDTGFKDGMPIYHRKFGFGIVDFPLTKDGKRAHRSHALLRIQFLNPYQVRIVRAADCKSYTLNVWDHIKYAFGALK